MLGTVGRDDGDRADGRFDLNCDGVDELQLEARKLVAVDVVAQGDRDSPSVRAATIKSHNPVSWDGDGEFMLEVRLRDDGDVDVLSVKEVTELNIFVPDGTSIPVENADGSFMVHVSL